MPKGKVTELFIAPAAGEPMRKQKMVFAVAGKGLRGDRYFDGAGSWNRGDPGKRQVTLINHIFFAGSRFYFAESRRNIVTNGIELMSLIGKTFKIGEATFLGVKYCEPCRRPSKLADKELDFGKVFSDCGGLIASVVKDGKIMLGDDIVPLKSPK